MRFAPALFLMPALLLAACSSPVPATPDSAWIVNMIGGAGCTLSDSMIGFGDSNINADAIHSGNGGSVAVWSDGYTQFAATITAKGGALSGKGKGKPSFDFNNFE